jgi:class 3 adenylate cyclase
LDGELQWLAREHGCWYSRYADDLTFSTNRGSFPVALANFESITEVTAGAALQTVISTNGFSINPGKVRLQRRADRQAVTGLIVNEHANVDRRYIRRIRAMIHAWSKYGLPLAEEAFPAHDKKDRHPGAQPGFMAALKGRIAYLSMVRGPDDPIVQRFQSQLVNLLHGESVNHGLQKGVATVHMPRHPTSPGEERLRTVIFTDIVGSTALAASISEARYRAVIDRHDWLVRREFLRYGAREMNSTGDGFFAVIDDPTQGVHCAGAIAAVVRELDVEVRTGLHTGLVRIQGTRAYGFAISVGARVMGFAGPSEVLVSQTIHDLLLASDFEFRDRGEYQLRNVPGLWHLFQVMNP